MNVFQKCNGVDGVAQRRILKRNRQDIKRSEIEISFFLSAESSWWKYVHDGYRKNTLPLQSSDYENENLKDILFHTGVLVVYKPHRLLWVLFPLHFCGDWICDSAVENRFVGGDFNGMTSDPSFACGYERSLYNSLTETNLDCWNTSYGITSKISSCTFILRTGCVF